MRCSASLIIFKLLINSKLGGAMRTIRNPRQTRLFDPFDPVLTERTRRTLLED